MCMAFARRRIAIGAVFTLLSVTPGFSAEWDRRGAERAFEEARQGRAEIALASQPSRQQYL